LVHSFFRFELGGSRLQGGTIRGGRSRALLGGVEGGLGLVVGLLRPHPAFLDLGPALEGALVALSRPSFVLEAGSLVDRTLLRRLGGPDGLGRLLAVRLELGGANRLVAPGTYARREQLPDLRERALGLRERTERPGFFVPRGRERSVDLGEPPGRGGRGLARRTLAARSLELLSRILAVPSTLLEPAKGFGFALPGRGEPGPRFGEGS
jgi:hypothetical protein